MEVSETADLWIQPIRNECLQILEVDEETTSLDQTRKIAKESLHFSTQQTSGNTNNLWTDAEI